MKDKEIKQGKGMKRRSFLKWSGASILSTSLLSNARIALGLGDIETKDYWHLNAEGKEYCVHDTVNTSKLDDGIIWAKVDGWWCRYKISDLDEKFMEWYLEEKLLRYEDMEKGSMWWGGHHHPAVATYGNRRGRGDSSFHLNNTTKGVGIVPKYEKLVEINKYIEDHQDLSGTEVLGYLKSIYSDPEIWDPTKLMSIEYYTKNPDLMRVTGYKETHTFLNMMENPIANLCFLAVWRTNYANEIRTIPYLIDLENPNLTEEEIQYAKYPNYLYTWYHKEQVGSQYIACYYHVIEEFSQGTLSSDSNAEGRGVRIVPPPPHWIVKLKDGFNKLFARA